MNDPTGLRRLVAAVDKVYLTQKGYGELLEAAAAVDVDALEVVVKAAVEVDEHDPVLAQGYPDGKAFVAALTKLCVALARLERKKKP